MSYRNLNCLFSPRRQENRKSSLLSKGRLREASLHKWLWQRTSPLGKSCQCFKCLCWPGMCSFSCCFTYCWSSSSLPLFPFGYLYFCLSAVPWTQCGFSLASWLCCNRGISVTKSSQIKSSSLGMWTFVVGLKTKTKVAALFFSGRSSIRAKIGNVSAWLTDSRLLFKKHPRYIDHYLTWYRYLYNIHPTIIEKLLNSLGCLTSELLQFPIYLWQQQANHYSLCEAKICKKTM